MGIYEYKTTSDPILWASGATTHWELSDPGYGQKRRRLVISMPWQSEPRYDCFCCSCEGDGIYNDHACRNHGWDGERPCELHGLAGYPDDTGLMPDSVQARRAAWARP